MITKIVGILNVTPDSFSDGGAAFAPGDACVAALRMREEGADIIDIGAESTRPGATPISPEEEWARLKPVLAALSADLPYGIDTRHAATAAKALQCGARWINDVSGFGDPAMAAAVKASSCRLVVMHSLTVPADKSITLPPECDPVAEVLTFAGERITALEKAGIERSRIIFDPGIGFGKTPAQSLALMDGVARFQSLGVELLIGHSRKSFLLSSPSPLVGEGGVGDNSPHPNALRDIPLPNPPPQGGREYLDKATLDISRRLAAAGIDYLRVHDVAGHRRMLAGMI